MSHLRAMIESVQRKTGGSWTIIEQDYALSLMLYGISKVECLKEHLIFKGGTCLKKYYFGNYRFSQDADFSVRGNYPKGDLLGSLLNEACDKVRTYFLRHDINGKIECIRYREKREHPFNQEAFTIAIQYPWQREMLTRVMIEVTSVERVILDPLLKSIIHGYEECV